MIYTLNLSADELNLIAVGLSKLPYEVAQPVIDGLKRIAAAQEAAAANANKPIPDASDDAAPVVEVIAEKSKRTTRNKANGAAAH